MLDKLDAIKARFDELGVALTNPEIVSDNKKFSTLSKEYRNLEKIVIVVNDYKKTLDDIEFNKEVLNGGDGSLHMAQLNMTMSIYKTRCQDAFVSLDIIAGFRFINGFNDSAFFGCY